MGRYTDGLRKRLRNPLPREAVAKIDAGVKAQQAATLKGAFDGACNITSCQKPIVGKNHWNSSTRAYYCEDCARQINFWSKKDHGVIICTAVTDPKDQPAYPMRGAA